MEKSQGLYPEKYNMTHCFIVGHLSNSLERYDVVTAGCILALYTRFISFFFFFLLVLLFIVQELSHFLNLTHAVT